MTLPFNVNPNQYKGVPYLRIDRALRFVGTANDYMSRTIGTPTSTTKFTISTWVKRTKLATNQVILSASLTATPSQNFFYLYFDANNNLSLQNQNGSVNTMLNTSRMVFSDATAWYHIVVSVDVTLATAANRTKLYVNGVAQTWTTQTNTQNPTSPPRLLTAGDVCYLNTTNASGSFVYSDQINAEVLFVDGQQLDQTSFGTWDTVTGVWQPIRYNGTFGNTGFYLTFQNNSTASTLGNDYSGVGNNFNVAAGVVLTGTNYASVIDSPTAYDDGSIIYNRGNYCVWNQYNGTATTLITNGGLTATTSTVNYDCSFGTFPMSSGKWYWEYTPTSAPSALVVGICNASITAISATASVWSNNNTVGYSNTGTKYVNGTSSAYGLSYTTNNVIGVALDLNAGTITFYKNNVSQGTITLSPVGTVSAYVPCMGETTTGQVNALAANFGQYAFTYTPPTGFYALNSYNMNNIVPPPIVNGSYAVAANQYTGTGASLSIANATANQSGTSFQPDLVWIKSASAISDHKWTDSVRGATNAIISNTTGAQTTDTGGVTSFNTTGFTVGTDATYNTLSARYVGYQWLAGNGNSANADGSIASVISASPKYGFSIVTYTGTGANATVGHGLGVAPQFIIIKQLTAASATNWAVYHGALLNTQYLLLNSTALAATGATYWNSTSPTSTTFSIGTAADVNTAGGTYVAYCWTPVSGYSAFPTWTGNGSTQNIILGFKPRFFMWKRSAGGVAGWYVTDSTRQAVNAGVASAAGNGELRADTTAAANNSYDTYLAANGIITASSQSWNNGSVFVAAAFAENPFLFSRAV